MYWSVRVVLLGCLSLLLLVGLGAQQPSIDQLKVVCDARVVFEKSGLAAAEAVVDDGFMSADELAAAKAKVLFAGDPVKKAGWEKARAELEAGLWSLSPEQLALDVGAWDRDKKQWPIAVTSLVTSFPVELQLVFNISAEDNPKALFDAVTANLKAKTLSARLHYRLVWRHGSTWQQVPSSLALLGKKASGDTVELYRFTVDQVGKCWDVDFPDSTNVTKAGVLDMVNVDGGIFKMSDPKNGTASTVKISGFRMSRTEVTQAQYLAVTGKNPSSYTDGTYSLQRPVENVSWIDAVTFCNLLSAKEGYTPAYIITEASITLNATANGYRLPTEVEWEFAARGGNAGSNYTYAGSNNIDDVAWYAGNSDGKTHPVATKMVNELGLYDMSGNVWEWCNDAASGSLRANRGGGWFNEPGYVILSKRSSRQEDWAFGIGFRVVR